MREKLLMNKGWRYFFGMPKIEKPKFESSDQQYRGSRAENARGPARRDYDDSAWRVVTLPHDFNAENGLSIDDPMGGEHYDFPIDRGEAWYRRYFRLDEADKDKQIILHFEGAGLITKVYVNSMLLKVNYTAGIGFDVDITDVARFGYETNVVSVHTDAHDYEAWYYEGAGITRNVWMVKTDKLAVDLWGTYVTSKNLGDNKWQLNIETEVVNNYYEAKDAKIVSKIVDPNGVQVAEVASDASYALRSKGITKQEVILDAPMLWDTKNCNMYKLFTEIVLDGEVVDNYETNFGIREIVYDIEKGMFLNGVQTTIYGFANHSLYLGVGEAMSDSMREYHIRSIHDMGGNGFRTAHAPFGEATYDYCDKYGLLVMDENRVFHSSDIRIDEVQRMVKRDRNHPSVCMWSLYNEEDSVTRETGKRIFRTLAEEARKIDNTRPMTGATSYGIFSEGAHEYYDIIGVNHQTMNFNALHKAKPDKPLYCSEMVIPLGPEPTWIGMNVRSGEDAHQSEKDFVIGGFHFTAWRYGPEKGEIMDGFGGKAHGYYGFQAYLKQDVPIAKVSPEWNFQGQEGEKVHLFLANNGDYVEVYVNGVLKDKVTTDLYAITPYEVVYEPGEIKIVAYKDGKVWAEDTSYTVGEPAAIKLVMDNPEGSLKADGDDVALIAAYIVDKDGRVCTQETGTELTFSSNDAGEFLSTGSVRADGYTGKNGPAVKVTEGAAYAYFRSLETEGDLVVTVTAKGLPTAELAIPRKANPNLKHVPVVESNYILNWQLSKLFLNGMDDKKIMKEHMIERWEYIDTQGSSTILYGSQVYPKGTTFHYALHAYATVPELGEKGDKKLGLYFEGIDGPANIYVTDGDKTAYGNHASNSPWFGHYRPEMMMTCDEFKPGDKVEIWVMMHNVGRVHGIGWPVRWIYTTDEEVKALDDKTAREWESSKQN